MIRTFTFLFFLFLSCQGALQAQKIGAIFLPDSLKFNNRYYKQELGLGFSQGFNAGGSVSLIWKRRDDKAKLIPVSYANFWRYSLATSSEVQTTKSDSFQIDNATFLRLDPFTSHTNFSATIGRERVNFYNRFNVYYGWEFGPDYNRQKGFEYGYYTIFNPQTGYFQGAYQNFRHVENQIGVHGGFFAGVKYHFSNRISLSVESVINLYYHYNIRKISSNLIDGGQTVKSNYHSFGHNVDFLRFVSVNYHFGRY